MFYLQLLCQKITFGCEQSLGDFIAFMQPCGHCGVCKKYTGEILLCLACSGIVEGCRDPKLFTPLKPMAFRDAFNFVV